ncbi:MAG: hypothetical protein GWP10_22385, partial [Nitrospiraceae bacterium]|nr:hypothetical protein [Nitrospiraceae bacterium]
MLRHFFHILFIVVIMTTQLFSQSWVPFLRQNKMPPEVTLLQSDNNTVCFTVKVYGMLATNKRISEKNYQLLSIPNSEVMTTAGKPALPVITKLIAVPDCDDVNITVTPSNKIQFSNYSVIPAPRYEKQDWPDGSHSLIPIYEEDASIYASDVEFPGKYGEIIGTGYVRAQKVVGVTLYPIQFSPVQKALTVFTDFQISLSFSSPTSPVNKELGIFRNMMHHVAINYELSGISASTREIYPINANKLGKGSMATGSVNRVTNLNLLTDHTNPMPVDYLIVTHSSLFNSTHLTSLANHRANHNGYDVVIVHVDDVDGPHNNDCIYEFYPRANNYESIRDFIADVYANGAANHTYDGHLGYIVLVGDAFLDDNSTEMVPASRVYQTAGSDPEISGEYLEYGSDYYYACVTQTGGSYDNDQDLMYGRISVGNEGELSNVVTKIVDYELYSSGAWRNNVAFMSFSPWFFDDDAHCDQYFKQMAQIVPQSYYLSYAWRGFAADTAQAHGRPNFFHHPVDQTSQVLVPDEADEMWLRRHTGWRWGYYPNYQYGGEYSDPNNLCSADEIDDWLYDQINGGLHTFVYEGHGRQASLGAGEGTGRTIFRANDIEAELSNYRMYPFIISNACATGYFDATTADMGSVDCIAERAVNLQNEGAIGFLGSARTSYTGAFNYVDRYILEAEYNHLSHVMGEAVMESKLRLPNWGNYLLYRRQYNLYGDPAVNLFPDGYTITEDLTLSGEVDVTTSISVASGVTMTIQPGATLIFHPDASLTINGTLIAQGTSANHITFTSSNTTPHMGDWKWIKFDNSSGTSILEYCDIEYSEIGIWANSSPNVTLN